MNRRPRTTIKVKQTARKSTSGPPPPCRRQNRVFYRRESYWDGVRVDEVASVPAMATNGNMFNTTGSIADANVVDASSGCSQKALSRAQLLADKLAAVESIHKLDGWMRVEVEGAGEESYTFSKEFIFRDFNKAWSFMCQVGVKLRMMNHHPNWHHVNNRVKVTLPSPDIQDFSTKDSTLAEFMEVAAKAANRLS